MVLGKRPKREYPSLVEVNISRIDYRGKQELHLQLLDRIPKRGYPSPVRMNISRIDSEGRNRNYIYQLLDRIPEREYPSSVKMNISRIVSAKGEAGFTTTSYWAEDHKEEEICHRLG